MYIMETRADKYGDHGDVIYMKLFEKRFAMIRHTRSVMHKTRHTSPYEGILIENPQQNTVGHSPETRTVISLCNQLPTSYCLTHGKNKDYQHLECIVTAKITSYTRKYK